MNNEDEHPIFKVDDLIEDLDYDFSYGIVVTSKPKYVCVFFPKVGFDMTYRLFNSLKKINQNT